MEAYDPSQTSAVLSFLSTWTSQLHADGYRSGAYSSSASGNPEKSACGATHDRLRLLPPGM